MSLNYEVIDHHSNEDTGYHYMILLIDGEPLRSKKTLKVQRFSAEAGSSGQDRMHKIAATYISNGHNVTAMECEAKFYDEITIYQLTKEESENEGKWERSWNRYVKSIENITKED